MGSGVTEFNETVRLAATATAAAPHCKKGRGLTDLRPYPEARAELRRGCDIDGQNSDVSYRLGIAHCGQQQHGRMSMTEKRTSGRLWRICPATRRLHRF